MYNTRSRSANKPIEDDDEPDEEPITPRKRRRIDNASTPVKKAATPKKFLTPTHKRINLKKPLEFTPLGTRILSPRVVSSPFQVARKQLHVSSAPAALPCREEEFAAAYAHLETAITDKSGTCIYISGTPGTGKTATIREVIAQLQTSTEAGHLDEFLFVEINGMKVTDPHQSYSLLWEALHNERVSPSHALELLDREFSSSSSNSEKMPCVVLMDELDQLVTKNQSVMYNFFNWPNLENSRLVVLAVANTMDLPERTLSNKISSRLGLTRITFAGYTHEQLMQIISLRLSNVPGHVVQSDAVQFAARKVAAVSGDARRALDICRRAVEIAEIEASSARSADVFPEDEAAPDTPTKSRTKKPDASTTIKQKLPERAGVVSIATIKAAINEATSSPLAQHLRCLSSAAKLFLGALLAKLRRTGIGEAVIGDVLDEAKRLAVTLGKGSTTAFLSKAGEPRANALGKPSSSITKDILNVTRVLGMSAALASLVEAGIVGVEGRRGERIGRIRLGVGEEEVRTALRDDEDCKGLGFGI